VAIYITARHMAGGDKHEHIAEVKWENRQTNETGKSSKAQMVTFIEGGGDARVAKGNSYVSVQVVDASPKYIRTVEDGIWTDNLLALPEY
jgi:catechol-2,3-dioxygenase